MHPQEQPRLASTVILVSAQPACLAVGCDLACRAIHRDMAPWKAAAVGIGAFALLLVGLKAGRFDDLVDWSIARAASWWTTAPAPQLCAA
jgi:hypothetical protein